MVFGMGRQAEATSGMAGVGEVMHTGEETESLYGSGLWSPL
jgi:hypothetical protein